MRIIKSELQTKADIYGKYILQTRMRKVVPPLATCRERRLARTIQNHNYILMKQKFIEKVFIHFKYQQNDFILDVLPNFMQNLEIQAVLKSKNILLYTP